MKTKRKQNSTSHASRYREYNIHYLATISTFVETFSNHCLERDPPSFSANGPLFFLYIYGPCCNIVIFKLSESGFFKYLKSFLCKNVLNFCFIFFTWMIILTRRLRKDSFLFWFHIKRILRCSHVIFYFPSSLLLLFIQASNAPFGSAFTRVFWTQLLTTPPTQLLATSPTNHYFVCWRGDQFEPRLHWGNN